MRATALRSVHESLGARMVPFAGWTMPVQYAGILEEVQAVRRNAGLFDLGHMGRVRIRGPQAEELLQQAQTNNAAAIKPGRIRYAMILAEDGGIEDDVLVYRQEDDGGFFVVLNAGNADKDLGILRARAEGLDVDITDQTEELGMLAIQGPRARDITQRLAATDLAQLGYYAWTTTELTGGVRAEISRTGYTGEDGFEVYVPQAHTGTLWQVFLDQGRDDGLQPIGLGARDTLRLEAGMALYGHEIDRSTNPFEAGLGWAVKLDHDFVGREALEAVRARGGTGRTLVGLKTGSRRVPRQGYELHAGGRRVGSVCSGAVSPTLGTNIATAYISEDHAAPGTGVEFAVRDKREPAEVTALPFYKRPR